jgi:ATP-binding cassette, subfamily B, bacterial
MHRDFRDRLKRGEDFKDEEDEDKVEGDQKGYFRDYLRFMRPFRGGIIVLLLMALVVAILDMLVPLATGKLVDEVLQRTGMELSEKRRLLAIICPALLAMCLVARGLDALRDYRTHGLNSRVVSRLRQTMYEHLLKLPLSEIHRIKTGRAVSRLTGDVDGVTGLMQMLLISPTVAFLRIIVALVIVLMWNWQLAMVQLILVLPLALISYLWVKPLRKLWEGWWRTKSKLEGRIHETFSGLRVVRAFQRESAESRRQQAAQHAIQRGLLHGVRLSALTHVIWGFLIPATGLVVLWWGGNLYLSERASMGQILAFNAYSAALMWPIYHIVSTLTDLQRSFAAVGRVFDILRRPTELADPPDAMDAPEKIESLSFENVSFSYSPDKPVIQDFTLTIPGGATVALVGPSGAGKSTLADLAARFYTPTAGRLLINGRDATQIKLHSYRRMLGMVNQDVFLFDGTVADNISFGQRKATRAEIEEAATMANAHEFILALPKGFDTLIGERGTKLSGGQRQRLSIARAILADPRLLILDEATSALDTESEQHIQTAMDTLRAHRTTFVIAHRLSTIASADLIIVLDKGKLVESGTHTDLMAANGPYATMVNRQRDAFDP